MDKLSFIKESLEHDLEYWKNAKEELEKDGIDPKFYRGAIASLEAFKSKIEFVFEEKEETEC